MFTEDDLIPISALQHLSFCERQWGLMYLEGIWNENPLTVEGTHLHDRAHEPASESRGDLRIARGLRLRSLRLGLVGVADVVEFHRVRDGDTGSRLIDCEGVWRPVPIEYKHGRPKAGRCDEVQLCAQALCLEEMLGGEVPAGQIYYGKTRRRHDVAFDATLRTETERLAGRLHMLTNEGKTPSGRYERKCRSCSLIVQCQPKATTGRSAVAYLEKALQPDWNKEP
jgi:CRISPR-associated exonuclease Cas4